MAAMTASTIKIYKMKPNNTFQNMFALLGAFIFDNKWSVVIVTVLVNGLFGLGLLSLTLNNDITILFLSRNTETKELGEKLSDIYSDTDDNQFTAHSSIKLPLFVELIVSGKENQNLLNPLLINETNRLLAQIKEINISSNYQGHISYEHLCEKRSAKCIIEGYEIIDTLKDCSENDHGCVLNISKLEMLNSKEIYHSIIDKIGSYTKLNGTITEARYFKFRLYLRQNTAGVLEDSKLWQNQFIQEMSKMTNSYLDIVYAHSQSLLDELGEETYPDIQYFGLAFTIFLTYCGFYVSGGDCVSKRVNIGRMGTIVGPLGVLGAWGLTCGSGWQFTNTTGVMPYIITYYELNNVLVTLNSATDRGTTDSARDRVVKALRESGVPISITTISYVAAFTVGTQSEYLGMQLVSIYTVSTICFIYINHMTFFTACLAIHEQRIDQNRHCCTCQEIQPKSEVTVDRSYCFLCCCTGDRSKAGENTSSSMETLSRKLVRYCVLQPWFKMLVLPLFVALTGLSIWQTCSFTIGDYKPGLLTSNSYYSKFAEVNDRVFTSDVYATFVVPGVVLYNDLNATKEISFLKENLSTNENVDLSSFIAWTDAYKNFLSISSPSNDTFDNSISRFLSSHPQFKKDFAFDKDGTIVSTRVYVKSRNVRNLEDTRLWKTSLLKDRYISESSAEIEHRITLFSPMFIFVDKHTRPLIESLIQIGVLVLSNIVLTTLVCPHARMFAIQLFSFGTTVAGIFGLMAVFSIEMTSFSMIIIVFGMCYIASINTHMVYSFYVTEGIDRQSRAYTVLSTTSISYFNIIIASVLGLLILLLIKSYIFVTVMHVLIINLVLGFIQAVLIYPVTLSLFGPVSSQDDLIVKRVSLAHIDLDNKNRSDLNAYGAYENPNFNRDDMEIENNL